SLPMKCDNAISIDRPQPEVRGRHVYANWLLGHEEARTPSDLTLILEAAEHPAARERATHQHAWSIPPCPSNPQPRVYPCVTQRPQPAETRTLRREFLVPLNIGGKAAIERASRFIAEQLPRLGDIESPALGHQAVARMVQPTYARKMWLQQFGHAIERPRAAIGEIKDLVACLFLRDAQNDPLY